MAGSDRRPVAVTELAQLARCEQQLLFDRQYGSRRPPERERAAQAGEWEHERHDHRVRRYQGRSAARDSRCFVASAVYGESAWQTEALRAWRDRVLTPSGGGRRLVRLYYRLSPPLARWLKGHPAARRLMRRGLDVLVARLARSRIAGGR